MPTAALEVIGNKAAHDLPLKTPWQRRWKVCERKRGEEQDRGEEEKGEK
jgi:hypothetical protein